MDNNIQRGNLGDFTNLSRLQQVAKLESGMSGDKRPLKGRKEGTFRLPEEFSLLWQQRNDEREGEERDTPHMTFTLEFRVEVP